MEVYKNYIITIVIKSMFVILLLSDLKAQTLVKQNLGSMSLSFTDNYQVKSTVGQLVVTTHNEELYSGFHQFDDVFLTTTSDISELDNICVFPNPISDRFTISVSELYTNLRLYMYTIDGKMLVTQNVDQLNTEVDVSQLQAGSYYMILYKDNQPLAHQKLIKN